MSDVNDLCRKLGSLIHRLPWYPSQNPCPITVVRVHLEEGPGGSFSVETVFDHLGQPLVDHARTYSGVDGDERLAVDDRGSALTAEEAEASRCYVGYDVEWGEYTDEDDSRTAKLISHQLYFAYNGSRKGLVVLTSVRFTEAAFVELLANAVPREINDAYLCSHFSWAEAGWLVSSLVSATRNRHLELMHDDPATAAAVTAEGMYVENLIAAIFSDDAVLYGSRSQTVAQKRLPSWLSEKKVKRVRKESSPRVAFNAWCRGEIQDIRVSDEARLYWKEKRDFSPVIPKRDKTWHGSTSLLRQSVVSRYAQQGKSTVAAHFDSRGVSSKAFADEIVQTITLRNLGEDVDAERLWRRLTGRGTDGRKAKKTAAEKAAVPRLPRTRLHFVDTTAFGLGPLSSVGETIFIRKRHLNPGEIERMDELVANDLPRFAAYGWRDACISAECCAWFARMFRIELGLTLATRTASYSAQHASAVFRDDVYREKITAAKKGEERNLKKYLGWDVRENKNGGKSWFPSTAMELFSRFYAGGWNAVHEVGSLGACTYWDLKSAYPCAILMLQHDYDFSSHHVANGGRAQEIADSMFAGGPFQIAGVRLSFQFKADAEPMFPVRIDPAADDLPLSPSESSDLILFTQSGEAQISWPEFWTAVNLDVLEWYQVSEIVYYDPLPGDSRFAAEVYRLLEMRGRKGRKVVYKNILNYLYGKFAESIKKKTINTAHGTGRARQRPGQVTCFPYAAYCTSVCRSVIGELLNLGNPCYSITTDGFVSPTMDYGKLKRGYISKETQRVLSNLKDYKGKTYQYIEPAYIASESLFLKTRGYVLAGTDDAQRPFVKLARMGIQTHEPGPEDGGGPDMRVAEFLNAINEGQYVKRSFPGFAKLKRDGKDLPPIKTESTSRANTTFDFKRVPVGPIDETVFEYAGVSRTQPTFTSRPLPSKAHFLWLRKEAKRNLDKAGYEVLLERYAKSGYGDGE